MKSNYLGAVLSGGREDDLRTLVEERDALEQELYESERYAAYLQRQLRDRVWQEEQKSALLLNSTSWKITSPLRRISAVLRTVISRSR